MKKFITKYINLLPLTIITGLFAWQGFAQSFYLGIVALLFIPTCVVLIYKIEYKTGKRACPECRGTGYVYVSSKIKEENI